MELLLHICRSPTVGGPQNNIQLCEIKNFAKSNPNFEKCCSISFKIFYPGLAKTLLILDFDKEKRMSKKVEIQENFKQSEKTLVLQHCEFKKKLFIKKFVTVTCTTKEKYTSNFQTFT